MTNLNQINKQLPRQKEDDAMSKAELRTNHGTFTGKGVDSIVRRRYGRKAYIRNDMVVEDRYRACHGVSWEANVLARVHSFTAPDGTTTWPGAQ